MTAHLWRSGSSGQTGWAHAAGSTTHPSPAGGVVGARSGQARSTALATLLVGLLVLLLALLSAPARAQDVLPVPALSGRLIDQAQLLDAGQRSGVEAQLADVEARLGSQMVVLIVPTTQPEDIAAYAQRVGDSWKIGRRDVGDGLLLVVASQDRTVRIEVAKALEGAIPDLMAKRVIDEALTPAFRRGDYAGGLGLAITRLGGLAQGEALPAPTPKARGGGSPSISNIFSGNWQEIGMVALVGVAFIAKLLSSVFGRRLGSMLTGAGLGGVAWLLSSSVFIGVLVGVVGTVVALIAGMTGLVNVLASAGGARGGGGWGGGGGFGSGGGGDFGGGGASGRW
jgi:uncharacterized protein